MSERRTPDVIALLRLIAALLVLPLAACGFEAPAPSRTPPPTTPAAPVSTISARLSVPIADILKILNARTQDKIADIRDQPVDCFIAHCSLDLAAVRTGTITGTTSGGSLSFTMPIAASAHMAVKGGFFRTSAQGQAQGVVQATTKLQLSPDWRLVSLTQGTVRLSEGQLKLGPVKTDIAELWNHNAAHLSDMLFRALDREIAGHVKIKTAVERLWAEIAKPIRIGRKPEAWLLLEPERIFVAQPVTQDNALVLSIGLAVRAHVTIGDVPELSAVASSLPPASVLAAPSDRFSVFVPVVLPYDTAARLAMQRLVGHPLRVAGMPVRITNLSILPSGSDVIVAAHFCFRPAWDVFGWFDSCGDGYLRGLPQYDARTQTIRIAKLHYDVTTANVLLVTAKSLAGSAMGEALQSRLVFPAGKDIAKLHGDVSRALAAPRGSDMRISGVVESFGQPSLTWTRDGFLALFPAQGHLSVQLVAQGT